MIQDYDRIILAVDGSKDSERAAGRAVYLANHLGTDIVAVHVLDTSLDIVATRSMSRSVKEKLRKKAENYLTEVKNAGKKSGVKVTTRILEGVPYNEITSMATDTDLIIIGSKGKAGIERALIGSVSEKVVRHSPCSVLIVKRPKSLE